jgi:hypothetical protein
VGKEQRFQAGRQGPVYRPVMANGLERLVDVGEGRDHISFLISQIATDAHTHKRSPCVTQLLTYAQKSAIHTRPGI